MQSSEQPQPGTVIAVREAAGGSFEYDIQRDSGMRAAHQRPAHAPAIIRSSRKRNAALCSSRPDWRLMWMCRRARRGRQALGDSTQRAARRRRCRHAQAQAARGSLSEATRDIGCRHCHRATAAATAGAAAVAAATAAANADAAGPAVAAAAAAAAAAATAAAAAADGAAAAAAAAAAADADASAADPAAACGRESCVCCARGTCEEPCVDPASFTRGSADGALIGAYRRPSARPVD